MNRKQYQKSTGKTDSIINGIINKNGKEQNQRSHKNQPECTFESGPSRISINVFVFIKHGIKQKPKNRND